MLDQRLVTHQLAAGVAGRGSSWPAAYNHLFQASILNWTLQLPASDVYLREIHRADWRLMLARQGKSLMGFHRINFSRQSLKRARDHFSVSVLTEICRTRDFFFCPPKYAIWSHLLVRPVFFGRAIDLGKKIVGRLVNRKFLLVSDATIRVTKVFSHLSHLCKARWSEAVFIHWTGCSRRERALLTDWILMVINRETWLINSHTISVLWYFYERQPYQLQHHITRMDPRVTLQWVLSYPGWKIKYA